MHSRPKIQGAQPPINTEPRTDYCGSSKLRVKNVKNGGFCSTTCTRARGNVQACDETQPSTVYVLSRARQDVGTSRNPRANNLLHPNTQSPGPDNRSQAGFWWSTLFCVRDPIQFRFTAFPCLYCSREPLGLRKPFLATLAALRFVPSFLCVSGMIAVGPWVLGAKLCSVFLETEEQSIQTGGIGKTVCLTLLPSHVHLAAGCSPIPLVYNNLLDNVSFLSSIFSVVWPSGNPSLLSCVGLLRAG